MANKRENKKEDKSERSKAGKIEEQTSEDQEEVQQEESESQEDFFESSEGFSDDFIPMNFNRANPILDINTSIGSGTDAETLEAQMQNLPSSKNDETEQPVSYVKNAPDYEGSDYVRGVYEAMQQGGRELKTDREIDITRGFMLHRQSVLEPHEDINIRAWRRETQEVPELVARGSRQEDFEQAERSYQVLGKKEKKERSKLPFQE